MSSLDQGVIKLSNAHIGRILDRGRTSMHALHLLAIKVARGPEWVLNEKHVSTAHAIGRRSFRDGIKCLQDAGIIVREQQFARRYATEDILPADTMGFTRIPRIVLSEPSDVVSFVIVTQLSPSPRRPTDVARRFGVKSKEAIARVVDRSVELRAIAFKRDERGAHWVARNEQSFAAPFGNAHAGFVPAENVLAEFEPAEKAPAGNVPSHMIRKNSNEYERGQVEGSRSRGFTPLRALRVADATRSDTLLPSCSSGPEPSLLELTDWRRSEYFQSGEGRHVHDDMASGPPRTTAVDFDAYMASIAMLGPVPLHIESQSAYEQVVEIADVATAICGKSAGLRTVSMIDGVFGVVARIARAHHQQKTIRSLGFIAESILRQIYSGDDVSRWAYQWPCRLSAKDVERLIRVATQGIRLANICGIQTDNDALCGKRSLLELDMLLRQIAEAFLYHRIAQTKTDELGRVDSWRAFL